MVVKRGRHSMRPLDTPDDLVGMTLDGVAHLSGRAQGVGFAAARQLTRAHEVVGRAVVIEACYHSWNSPVRAWLPEPNLMRCMSAHLAQTDRLRCRVGRVWNWGVTRRAGRVLRA